MESKDIFQNHSKMLLFWLLCKIGVAVKSSKTYSNSHSLPRLRTTDFVFHRGSLYSHYTSTDKLSIRFI